MNADFAGIWDNSVELREKSPNPGNEACRLNNHLRTSAFIGGSIHCLQATTTLRN